MRCEQALNCTLHDHILRLRVNHVKKLLASTNLTLAVIAERAGFDHVEYLSVAVKRATGLRREFSGRTIGYDGMNRCGNSVNVASMGRSLHRAAALSLPKRCRISSSLSFCVGSAIRSFSS